MDQNQEKLSSRPIEVASFRKLFIACSDILGTIILVLWALILGPLGLLRGTLLLSHVFWYIWILSPQGILSRLVKAAIDWRLGAFDAAVFQMEFLSSRVEAYLAKHPKYRHAHVVLEDFYTLLVRAYLHGGHIDDAMLVVLRAKKHLGTDRLPSLARLDAKTAHLVRAGLAAGKLLDGGGLATLFVKSNVESVATPPAPPQQKPMQNLKRQGATKDSALRPVVRPQSNTLAPVIAFPTAPRQSSEQPTKPAKPSEITPPENPTN
jgi:hypothetical protein